MKPEILEKIGSENLRKLITPELMEKMNPEARKKLEQLGINFDDAKKPPIIPAIAEGPVPVDIANLPKDPSELHDPLKMATYTQLANFLNERAKSERAPSKAERTALKEISDVLALLLAGCQTKNYKDWADSILKLKGQIDTILATKSATDRLFDMSRWRK